jgi:dTDP-4-dehydrorhamnose reductase|tara:strand:+ start:5028 stop:5927 length:900 start_codon:yes stop_codon:yes gene_type:complete
MRKVLITGTRGQLVTDLVEKLICTKGYELFLYNREGCDVTNYVRLEELFAQHNPDIYIHGPSVHNVEHIGNDINKACEVNIGSLLQASKLCNKHKTILINFSTNYVHSGISPPNYVSNEGLSIQYPAEPVNVYGITKAAGERIVSQSCDRFYNIRVSGVFGKTGSRAKNDDNFIYTILRQLRENGEVSVVNDQTLNVTYTKDAANVIEKIMDSNPSYGLFHVVNKGVVTWYDVAKFTAQAMGYSDKRVVPIPTEGFYSDIHRPQHTALSLRDTEQRLKLEVPSWQSAVVRFLREIGEIK